MENQGLLTCPFCGKMALVELTKIKRCQMHGDPYQNTVIRCAMRCATFEGVTLEIAASQWNRRAPVTPKASPAQVDDTNELISCNTCKVGGLLLWDFTARGEHAGHDIGIGPKLKPPVDDQAVRPDAEIRSPRATIRIYDLMGEARDVPEILSEAAEAVKCLLDNMAANFPCNPQAKTQVDDQAVDVYHCIGCGDPTDMIQPVCECCEVKNCGPQAKDKESQK